MKPETKKKLFKWGGIVLTAASLIGNATLGYKLAKAKGENKALKDSNNKATRQMREDAYHMGKAAGGKKFN